MSDYKISSPRNITYSGGVSDPTKLERRSIDLAANKEKTAPKPADSAKAEGKKKLQNQQVRNSKKEGANTPPKTTEKPTANQPQYVTDFEQAIELFSGHDVSFKKEGNRWVLYIGKNKVKDVYVKDGLKEDEISAIVAALKNEGIKVSDKLIAEIRKGMVNGADEDKGISLEDAKAYIKTVGKFQKSRRLSSFKKAAQAYREAEDFNYEDLEADIKAADAADKEIRTQLNIGNGTTVAQVIAEAEARYGKDIAAVLNAYITNPKKNINKDSKDAKDIQALVDLLIRLPEASRFSEAIQKEVFEVYAPLNREKFLAEANYTKKNIMAYLENRPEDVKKEVEVAEEGEEKAKDSKIALSEADKKLFEAYKKLDIRKKKDIVSGEEKEITNIQVKKGESKEEVVRLLKEAMEEYKTKLNTKDEEKRKEVEQRFFTTLQVLSKIDKKFASEQLDYLTNMYRERVKKNPEDKDAELQLVLCLYQQHALEKDTANVEGLNPETKAKLEQQAIDLMKEIEKHNEDLTSYYKDGIENKKKEIAQANADETEKIRKLDQEKRSFTIKKNGLLQLRVQSTLSLYASKNKKFIAIAQETFEKILPFCDKELKERLVGYFFEMASDKMKANEFSIAAAYFKNAKRIFKALGEKVTEIKVKVPLENNKEVEVIAKREGLDRKIKHCEKLAETGTSEKAEEISVRTVDKNEEMDKKAQKANKDIRREKPNAKKIKSVKPKKKISKAQKPSAKKDIKVNLLNKAKIAIGKMEKIEDMSKRQTIANEHAREISKKWDDSQKKELKEFLANQGHLGLMFKIALSNVGVSI